MSIKNKIRQGVADALELPREVILNLPLISLTGKEEVAIENYKGIIEYTEKKIRINTNAGVVKIEGNALNLKHLNGDNIVVKGAIEKVEFV